MTQTELQTPTDGPTTQTLADLLADGDVQRGPVQIDLDGILDVLQNNRRRAILAVMTDDAPVRKRDLSDHVADLTIDGQPDTDWEKTTYVTLHQNHLPKLEDYGVVTVDDGVVDRGPNWDAVMEVKRRIDGKRVITDAVEDALGRIGDAFR